MAKRKDTPRPGPAAKRSVASRSAKRSPAPASAAKRLVAPTSAAKRPVAPRPEPEEVYAADRAAWRRWLTKHHATSPGVWLIYDKMTSRPDRLAYADAVEEALCFGWIDSVMRPLDAHRYKQMYTPRKPKSAWSKLNKERVARLMTEKKMMPAGLACIEQAKRNGSWTQLDAVEAYIIPPDLGAALSANPRAKKHFDAFPPSARKGYLYWLTGAKRPETRAARLKEIVARAEANEKVRALPPRPSA